MPSVIRLGVLEAPSLKTYAIKNSNDTTSYAFFANEIRYIFEALNVRYDLITAADGKLGYEESDGNWSGLLGILVRSEVDVMMYPIPIETNIPENTRFSYPYGVSDLTFMTNKPEPVSKSSAILHPFPYSMWISLAIILIIMPILFYIFMIGKVRYQSILLNVFGSLLEQGFNVEVITNSARMLLAGWILGVMIISYGYKAVLLSFLSFPSTTVIRDIPELGRAAAEGSITCTTTHGSDHGFFTKSDIESWRAIGACLKRNKDPFKNAEFFALKSKKAHINSRRGLSFDEKYFYISADSFTIQLYSFGVSSNFCCSKKFDRLINQLHAVGLSKKFEEEEKFFWQRFTKSFSREDSAPSAEPSKIMLYDISGAFIILISGWVSAFLALVGEIFMQKYVAEKK